MIRDAAICAATLGLAVAARFALPTPDADGSFARSLIGQGQRQRLAGQPAYRYGQGALLFFEADGFARPFRGALLLEDGFVEDLFILSAREGLDGEAFTDERLLAGYRGRPARSPLVVDALAGATISCRALQTAVNERLRAWQESGHALD